MTRICRTLARRRTQRDGAVRTLVLLHRLVADSKNLPGVGAQFAESGYWGNTHSAGTRGRSNETWRASPCTTFTGLGGRLVVKAIATAGLPTLGSAVTCAGRSTGARNGNSGEQRNGQSKQLAHAHFVTRSPDEHHHK